MSLRRTSVEELQACGMLGATLNKARGTLTLHFTHGEEIWTLAPAEYPRDGSREVLTFAGEYYVPPPTGAPA